MRHPFALTSMFVAASLCAASALAAPREGAARLDGLSEVPAVSTPASGSLRLRFQDGVISYRLDYRGVASGVTQAHIHFGLPGTSGGISVFLCSSIDDPDVSQDCPAGDATVTGTITAESVVGPTTQGIAVGDFEAFLDALPKEATYANVHSATFPGGEIRGQIRAGR